MKIGRYDAILGQKWLWQYDIHILPSDHILHFHKGKKIKLYRDKETRHIPLVSVVQLKRVARKTNSQAYAVFIRESLPVENKENELPKGISSLLQEYGDVFPSELPKSLPQERNVDHHIELEPGTRPTHIIPYKLSRGEKEEVEKQIHEFWNKDS